jgi:GNAT superfamily N-acetyltransferase
MIDVVPLPPAQFRQARTALGRAFYDYNVMVHAAPDAARRAAGVTTLYGAFLSDCLRFGEVYGTPDVVGAACWLPPERSTITLLRQIRSGMYQLPLRFGIAGFVRLLAYDAIAWKLHHAHASQPHWYLVALGVEPERQGQGIGGALMQPILARADARNLPCYLETHRPENVRLYQRHGFEICCHCDVPGHPIPVWAMLRRPRPTAG